MAQQGRGNISLSESMSSHLIAYIEAFNRDASACAPGPVEVLCDPGEELAIVVVLLHHALHAEAEPRAASHPDRPAQK